MKRTLLIVLIFFFSLHSSFAQDCSGVKRKTDAFTREQISTASLKCGNLSMTLERSGDKYYIGFFFMMGSYSDAVFAKGEKVMLRLDNDEIVEVENDHDFKPTSTPGNVIWTRWTTKSQVDEQLFEKLGKHSITGIRFMLAGNEQTQGVKDRQADKIREAAACITTGG